MSKKVGNQFFWLLVILFSTLGVTNLVVAEGDYRIAPRDEVKFMIFEEPDTLIVQRVSASGELPLPLVGVVKVAGLTLREAEIKLQKLYVEKGFYISPQVILVLLEYNARSVSVLGQVGRPSQVPFPIEKDSLSIVQAITAAGGFTRLAKPDSVQVTRLEGSEGEKRFTVNVDSYLAERKKGDSVYDRFDLLPGDVVFVPERSF